MIALSSTSAVLAAAAVPSHAVTWEWKLPTSVKHANLLAEICPLKYGKMWAYSVEIDDGPTSTLTVSQPLLARYSWNDAPPNVTGGQNHPFVGTAAVMFIALNVDKPTNLDLQQVRQLQKAGWGIANHSYWHSGNHWDPANYLKPADFRRELFWSQTLYAEFIGDGRAATHFVYPNGDYNYGPYLEEYGLRSASLVNGSSPHNLLSPKADLKSWNRAYLDENVWAPTQNALIGFPKMLTSGDFLIDFTHGMDADPHSDNQKRWITRLDHIARIYGPQGDNSVWVAPSDAVFNYSRAAHAATVTIRDGRLTVSLPETYAGSALTLKLHGVNAKAILPPPSGAVLYRHGDTIWLTTPQISKSGAAPVTPHVHRIYAGKVKNLTWDKPVTLAGVRLRQFGPPAQDFILKLDIVTPGGAVASLLPGGQAKLGEAWGNWLLYPTVPDHPAPLAKELHVTPDRNLKEMEVWAITK